MLLICMSHFRCYQINRMHLNLVEAAEDEGEVSESLLLWKQKELTITRIQ